MTTLRIIERQLMARQAAEKAKPTPASDGLAVEIDRAITKAVEQALASHQAALRAAQTPRPIPVPSPEILRRLEALEGRAVKDLPILQFERGADGLLRAANIGSKRFLVQRDSYGSVIRLVPDDGTHARTTVKPAPINQVK